VCPAPLLCTRKQDPRPATDRRMSSAPALSSRRGSDADSIPGSTGVQPPGQEHTEAALERPGWRQSQMLPAALLSWPADMRSDRLTTIPFVLMPLPTNGRNTICMLRLQHASLNKQTTVAAMRTVNSCISGKDRLNQMVALIVGPSNPDALGLINSRRKHSSHSLSVYTTLVQAPTCRGSLPLHGISRPGTGSLQLSFLKYGGFILHPFLPTDTMCPHSSLAYARIPTPARIRSMLFSRRQRTGVVRYR